MSDKIKNIYDQITPDENAQERVLSKINQKLKEKNKMSKKTFIKSATALVAMAAILAVCVLNIPQKTNSLETPAANTCSIVAYASDGSAFGEVKTGDMENEIPVPSTLTASGEELIVNDITLEVLGDNVEKILLNGSNCNFMKAGGDSKPLEVTFKNSEVTVEPNTKIYVITNLKSGGEREDIHVKAVITYKDGTEEVKEFMLKAN